VLRQQAAHVAHKEEGQGGRGGGGGGGGGGKWSELCYGVSVASMEGRAIRNRLCGGETAKKGVSERVLSWDRNSGRRQGKKKGKRGKDVIVEKRRRPQKKGARKFWGGGKRSSGLRKEKSADVRSKTVSGDEVRRKSI